MNNEVLVPADLAVGLLEVLEEASGKGGLTGTARKQAIEYAKLLETKLKEKGTAGIQLSMATVASILRIILMILLPEPLGHAIMMTLEKMF